MRKGRTLLLVSVCASFVALSSVVLVAPAGADNTRGVSDIVMENVAVGTAEVLIGDSNSIAVFVRNDGPRASGPVTVTVTLSAGLETEPVDVDPAWTCSSSVTSWTCTHAGIAAHDEVAETLVVGAKVVGGMPGDVLVVTASAQTTGRELRTNNNSGQASMTVVDTAVISGAVWNDLDRDGQREAGEPPVSSGPDGVQALRLIPQNSDILPAVEGVVTADGTYSVILRPGLYVLQVQVDDSLFTFSPPNVGDDATDSDLVFFEVTDPGVRVGTTDVINLDSGSLTPGVDAGLVAR
jgi:SdrD B-like domain/Domain of unknown function DUF11